MAAKSDKPARSAGLKQAAIAGSVFLVMTMIWVFVYLYLNGKKIDAPAATQTQSIVTDPVITTRLIAPVDIKFDGTKIPYNPNILELTFYQWDFGDGSSSTSPSVTHTYNQVGQFDVKLVVTARNKQTNQTLTQNFNKLVTVSEVKVSASFTATPTSGPAPLSVEFDASASKSPAGQIRSYEWDFQGLMAM
jgi:PKD repeat protein